MPTTTLSVNIKDATLEQLAAESVRLMHTLHVRFDHLETRMSELTKSVDALKEAVDGVAQRQLIKLAALETALTAAQADDANAAAALADATAATASIRIEVDRLNALGASPSTPVDPAAPQAEVVPEVEVVSEPQV